jgi:hypothetical protein
LRGLIDGSRLHGSNLMLTQGLAHDVEAARKGRILEVPSGLIVPIATDRRGQGLFGVGERQLSLGQRGREGGNRFT